MAGPFDFTGQNIEDSYQRVLQTDGTLIYDGTGSLFTTPGNINTGSFVTTGSFNSYTGSNTSQFAGTASFVQNAQTASYVLNAVSSSFASTASYVQNAVSASYAANGGVTQLLAGPNISLSPTNGLGQVTVSSTPGGGGFNTATGSYGSFYSTQTQTNVAGTARSMSLNTTDITNGISISGSTNPYNTYIKTENAGIYDIQFSAQVDKTDSGTDEIWIWIRKNGTNLSDTATSVQLTGNGAHYVAAWNFFVNAAANDYFQLMWYSPDANVRLHAEPAFGVVPGIPSLIVTANRVDQFLSNTGSFSGSFTGNFTGSLLGTATTASYVLNAVSSSFASTASFVRTAQTASYVLNAISSSFASTASFVNPLTQTVIINGKLIQTGSHAQGFNTNTAGNYSHAEGNTTFSTGNYSHAEGYGVSSTGESSHAEGYSSNSTGQFSHAEGVGTISSGYASHAEGSGTTATGEYSHAEGNTTFSTGNYSHAEGFNTTATGNWSHAEGSGTTAGQLGYDPVTSITSGVFELNSGYGDLTSLFSPGVFVLIDDFFGEINGTPNIFKLEVLSSTYTGTPATEITLVDTSINTSSPKYSVGIHGDFNPSAADVPIGSFSHTSGESTHTVGNGSSAKGTSTEALGYYSHAEGRQTTANGYASHAEGRNTIATGDFSHAEGYYTVASGSYQHVQGQYNLSSSAQSAFIVGNGTADASRSNLIFASGSQVQITGSLIVSGSGTFINIGPAVFSGSVTSTAGFTGSLQGTAQTASYVLNAVSSSFAQTASFFSGTVVSASYAQTASFVQNAQTASFVQTAQTASFIQVAQTASYVTGSIFTNGNIALSASYAISSSFAVSASWAPSAGGGASIYKLTSQTLPSSSWVATGSYYTSSFANANITSNTRVDFTPDNASYTEVTTAGILPQVTVTTGTASFYALFPPQTNITGEITIFPTV